MSVRLGIIRGMDRIELMSMTPNVLRSKRLRMNRLKSLKSIRKQLTMRLLRNMIGSPRLKLRLLLAILKARLKLR